MPFCVLYVVAYFCILRRVTYEIPPLRNSDGSDGSDDADATGDGSTGDVSREALLTPSTNSVNLTGALAVCPDDQPPADHGKLPPTRESGWRRTVRVAGLVKEYGVFLGLVYFFEYVASVGCADRANPKDSDQAVVRNAYAILAFCYQVRTRPQA